MPSRPSPPRLTHFPCIPLITSTSRHQLQNSLNAFVADVTNDRTPENPTSIPKSAVRPLGTIHLTLGVMSLLTQERVNSALELLKSLNIKEMLLNRGLDVSESAIDAANPIGKASGRDVKSETLTVTLRGLKSMHPPSKTSILYTSPIDEDLGLLEFCLKLKDAFVTAELLVPDTRPLLLHATIVNTIYVPGVKGKRSGHGKSRARLTIDASEIVERYQDFEWMSNVGVEKVAICQMGAKKLEDGDEEYVIEGEVAMP